MSETYGYRFKSLRLATSLAGRRLWQKFAGIFHQMSINRYASTILTPIFPNILHISLKEILQKEERVIKSTYFSFSEAMALSLAQRQTSWPQSCRSQTKHQIMSVSSSLPTADVLLAAARAVALTRAYRKPQKNAELAGTSLQGPCLRR